jgi:ABC-type multidrug transport system permease subunit|tara:strand:+ start:161 stop:388 length:228 start_codon:yes stop_codon:yes gene_type:complete
MGISKKSIKTGFNRIGIVAGIITGVLGLIFYSLIMGQSGWTFLKLLVMPVPFLVSFFIGWLAISIISWVVSGFID